MGSKASELCDRSPPTCAMDLEQQGTANHSQDGPVSVTKKVLGALAGTFAVMVIVAIASGAPETSINTSNAPVNTNLAADTVDCFDSMLQNFLKENGIPGANVAVTWNGDSVYEKAYGNLDVP